MQFEGFLTKPINLQELSTLLQKYISVPPSEITSESTKPPLIPPAAEQLETILQLGKIGDMEAIIELANQNLQQLDIDSRYHPFWQKVTFLAESFQQYQLIKSIENFLE